MLLLIGYVIGIMVFAGGIVLADYAISHWSSSILVVFIPWGLCLLVLLLLHFVQRRFEGRCRTPFVSASPFDIIWLPILAISFLI